MESLIYEQHYDTTLMPSQHFPDYHIMMLNDARRNALYDKAIAKYAPNRVVLDLGSGSGLLSMMALRAGAKKVFAVEQDPWLVQQARIILTQNKLFDHRIRIINASIDQLVNSHEIDESVDLIITEIFDCGLIGEGCLSSIAQAKYFLKPDGRVIPLQGSIHAFLVDSAQLRAQHLLPDDIMGFDFSALIELRQMGHMDKISSYTDARVVSNTLNLLTLDFQQNIPTQVEKTVAFTVHQDASIDAMVVYFQLLLAPSILLKSISSGFSHWNQWLLFPKKSIRVHQGDTVTVHIHNKNHGKFMSSMWRRSR